MVTYGAAAVALGLAGLNVWWLWEVRSGHPFNYDEAAYLSIGAYDALSWSTAGPYGLVRSVLVQGPAAPLLPLLATPIHLLAGAQPLPALLVVQGFFVMLVLATYLTGRRLAGGGLGLLAAGLVATAPGVTELSRMFHPAVPSAALFMAAVYAQLRSDGLRGRGWVVAWGLLLGLLTLTRTVALALVPALVLVAALQLIAGGHRLPRMTNLALGIASGFLVASIWYWRNLPRVLEYLVAGGYGETSGLYGAARTAGSWEFWAARLSNVVQQGLYLPLAVGLVVVLILGLASVVSRPGGRSEAGAGLQSRRPDVLVVSAVLLFSYLVLSSSRNVGSGFVLMLVPPLVVLAISALGRVQSARWRAGVGGILVMIGAANALMHTPAFPALSAPRMVEIPGLGGHPITDGRADIQKILAAAGYDDGPPSRIALVHYGWQNLDREVAVFLAEHAAVHRRRPVAWFASRDPLFGISSVRLAGLLHLRQDIALDQLPASLDRDRDDVYRDALAAASPQPNFLITGDPGAGEFPPPITQALAEAAARSLGFEPVRTFVLPDGREARVWWRDTGPSL